MAAWSAGKLAIPKGPQLNQDCHRSYYGYPQVVAATKAYNMTDLACSGAATKSGGTDDPANGGILTGQSFGADGTQPAQLGQTGVTGTNAPNPAYDNAHPDVVTLTVGMNDVNFAGVLDQCYQPFTGDCNNDATITSTLNNAITHFQGNLDAVLDEIQARDLVASPSKVPHVYVTGYYNPFGSARSCGDIWPSYWANAGLSDNEITWLEGRLAALNQKISDEATAHSSFVTYVDIANVLDSHKLCDSDPWVYGPLIQAPLTSFGSWVGGNNQMNNPAPFHPTDLGQRAIATRVMTYTS